MWIGDLTLGKIYLLGDKPVILIQTRTTTHVGTQLDEHSCIVRDPMTYEDIHCKPHELKETPHVEAE